MSESREPRISPLNDLYYDIHSKLRGDEAKAMKKLLRNTIPMTDMESLDSFYDVLVKLEEQLLISAKNLGLVRDLLLKVGRNDIAELVRKFEESSRDGAAQYMAGQQTEVVTMKRRSSDGPQSPHTCGETADGPNTVGQRDASLIYLGLVTEV
ncbi:uncharacterized protein [Ptychodera flava]|uniref:uncharacterized protein n=1 Tax=Ptychodera flava TaxID=63121 RepID=UPI00396A87B1